MKNGEMDAEPENNLGKHEDAPAFAETGENYDNSDADEDEEATSAAERSKPESKKKPKSKDKEKTRKKHAADSATKAETNLTIEGDDFFGSD